MSQSAMIAATAAKNPDLILGAYTAEMTLFIPAATDPATVDPRDGQGNAFQAVIWQEKIWFRNESDHSAADSITVITLADGVNYLTNDVRIGTSVLSRTTSAPPGSPTIGDSYIVPAAATGAWATHDDAIAIYTARSWQFVAATHGQLVLVEDEGTNGQYVHFDSSDAWADGVPGGVLAGEITPSMLLIRAWAAENETTTAPPTTGPAGETYIIGAGATGAWSGNDKKIAYRASLNAAFTIVTPFVGEQVYDKNLGVWVRWDGSAWNSTSGIIINRSRQFTAGTGSTTSTGGGASSGYAYSTGTAPTTSNRRVTDNVTISYTARNTSSKLRFRYDADFTTVVSGQNPTTAYDAVIGLYRDSEVNAVAWARVAILPQLFSSDVFGTGDGQLGIVNGHISQEFEIDAIDASAHTYKIALMSFSIHTSVNFIDFQTLSRREFLVNEASS